ncbi:MAG: hypothetical protein RIR26_763 [Pseudomonadota bacterium]
MGPLATREVLELLQKNPSMIGDIQWISPAHQTPLLLREWFFDFAPDVDLEALKAKVPLQAEGEPFAESTDDVEDVEDGTPAMNGSSRDDRIQTFHPFASEASAGEESPEDGEGLADKKKRPRWRDWLGILGLGVLGFAFLTVGARSLRPHKTAYSGKSTMKAQVLGSTPDALRAYQSLLEAKIARDPKKYARALVQIQRDKGMYPEGQIPSAEMTAAIALVNLSNTELDKRDDWKQILSGLSSESRQRGIAVVAYELSRVFDVRRQLLTSPSNKKKKAEQEKKAIDEVAVVLERLTRVVPAGEPRVDGLQGLFLARVLSQSLLTVLEHHSTASKSNSLKESVKTVPALYPFLNAVDKGVVSVLHDLVIRKWEVPAAKTDWNATLSSFVQLNETSRFLCQLNESGAAVDVILYTLARAASEKSVLPEIPALFDECFVGLRVYPRVVGATSPSSDVSSPLEYAGVGPQDEALLRDFRREFPTAHPALSRIAGNRSAAGDWLLALHFNGVTGGRLTGKGRPPKEIQSCEKAKQKSRLCQWVTWVEGTSKWREKINLLPEAQELSKPDEIAQLTRFYVLQSVRDIHLVNSKDKKKEILEVFRATKAMGTEDDPQLQFILDYVQSLDGES